MGCRPTILGLAIALVVSGATAYETRGSRPPVAFGFTDKTGTRVLAEWPEFTPPLDPRTLTTALCSAGRRVTVSFVTYQSAREGDSGRQVAENFVRAQGSVYRIVDGKVPPDVTCIVFGAPFLSTRRIAGVSVAGIAQCDASRVQRIGAERSRPVARCSRLAMLEG